MSNQDYEWIGTFPDQIGGINIISNKGQIRAHVDYNGDSYEIFPLEGDIHAIAKIVPPKEQATGGCAIGSVIIPTGEKIPQSDDIGENEEGSESSRVLACTPSNVRVLFLATPAARARMNPIITTAQLAVSQFNQAQISSAVRTPRARLEIAGIYNIAFNENRFNPVNDIEDLVINAEARRLRDALGADLVVMLTDGNYTTPDGDLYGIAGNFDASFNLGLIRDRSFAIVEADWATANYTFAHEVGHLFVALHQDCAVHDRGCDNNGTFNHGYGFTRGGSVFRKTRRYRTIMHVIRDNCSRIDQFSNPNVTYDTKATGTAARNDNTRQFEIAANTVSRYRTTRERMSALIQGPTSWVPGISVPTYYTADVRCGNPTHRYSWEVSFDGFNYSPAGTSDRYYPPFFNVPNASRMYMRCRITSADAQQVTAFKSVSLSILGGREGDANDQDSTLWIAPILEGNELDGIVLEDAYPNPVNNHTQIGFSLPESQSISLDILDVTGKLVKNVLGGIMEPGSYEFEVQRGDLSHGLYYYQLSVGDTKLAKRLLITE